MFLLPVCFITNMAFCTTVHVFGMESESYFSCPGVSTWISGIVRNRTLHLSWL